MESVGKWDAPERETAPTARARLKVSVYQKGRTVMPKWSETMLVGRPSRTLLGVVTWQANRNGSPLNSDERAEWDKGRLLLIPIPDVAKDLRLDELLALIPARFL